MDQSSKLCTSLHRESGAKGKTFGAETSEQPRPFYGDRSMAKEEEPKADRGTFAKNESRASFGVDRVLKKPMLRESRSAFYA